jgi:hypothetical protein
MINYVFSSFPGHHISELLLRLREGIRVEAVVTTFVQQGSRREHSSKSSSCDWTFVILKIKEIILKNVVTASVV